MSRLDFHFEFYTELSRMAAELRAEAERRLQALAADHTDMIGAAVTVEELSKEETPHLYRARVVAYIRPENIAAVEKQETPEGALRTALQAVEQQVRERRALFRQPWEQPDKAAANRGVYELTPRELYDAYAAQLDVVRLVELDRTYIAARLMTDEGLDQQAAYYVADQLLIFAQEIIESVDQQTPES